MDRGRRLQHKLPRVVRSLGAGAIAIAVIVLLHTIIPRTEPDQQAEGSSVDEATIVSHGTVDTSTSQATAADEELPRLPLPAVALSEQTSALVDRGGIAWARSQLLEQATEAVAVADDHLLAKLLAELGELSLIEADIDTAEMYLTESLDLAQQLGDELAQAGVYMQLGRLHLLSRKRARVAANAYDTLLVSRWRISQGQFYAAEADLLRVADNNLKLERYGAAASTYATLYRGYREAGDSYQAQTAGIEAMKLYASSGRMADVQILKQKMISHGVDDAVFDSLQPELDRLRLEFDRSVSAMNVARDQAQLYNQLQARGDVVNAWRFRQQSNATLAKASKRAQYRSQPDVLAELYRSNRSMKDAQQSLSKANAVFYEYGFDTEYLQSLQREVY